MTDGVRDRFGSDDAPEPAAADAPAVSAARPDVSGLASWDGVPSLGGIWIAHPDVVEAVRVRIARADGGPSIDGWLFGRDAGGEGPNLQLSSEAAAALDIPPGEIVDLTVEPLAAAAALQAG